MHLNLSLSASYRAHPDETVYCMTMPLEVYDRCVGAYQKKEIKLALKYLYQIGIAEHLPKNS